MSAHFYEIGYSKLLDYQIVAYEKCIKKGKGGISLKMGFGKTLLSIVVALYQKSISNNDNPILIIASKSLISSWIFEISKFFTNLPYEIIDTKVKTTWTPKKDTLILLLTPEVLSKGYKLAKVENKFVQSIVVENEEYRNLQQRHTLYISPNIPMTNIGIVTGTAYFYSVNFPVYIIDEAQKFNNISTIRCKALASICARHRWLLSGTLFDEPVIGRIMGYYMILDDSVFPRTLADASIFIKSPNYEGLKTTLVTAEMPDKQVTVIKHIIPHKLSQEEGIVYKSLRNTLKVLKDAAKQAQQNQDITGFRKFNAYLLVMIGYFRQCIVTATIPLSLIYLNMLDFENRTQLSTIMTTELRNNAIIENIDIDQWLSKKESIKSNRIIEVFKTIKHHMLKGDKMILFSCYVMSLDLIEYLLKNDPDMELEIIRLTSDMSQSRRGSVINHFNEESEVEGEGKGRVKILLLSFELGAEGYNLQTASTMIFLDLWWNHGKVSQAIARIARKGQKASEVNVYIYTSNTGIERAILEKHSDKLTVYEELLDGCKKTKITTMSTDDIIKLIYADENIEILTDIMLNNNAGKVTQRLKEEAEDGGDDDEEKWYR